MHWHECVAVVDGAFRAVALAPESVEQALDGSRELT
jgi:hypothetical protein